MKLPMKLILLVVSAAIQADQAFAQIHGGMNSQQGINERPGRYPGDSGGGVRPTPEPRPHPRPAPEPRPYPNPEPRPYPHPHPTPEPRPYPHPHPHPAPEPRPYPRPYPQPYPHPEPRPYPTPYPREPRPYPEYPRDNYGQSSVQFYTITRRSGGEWLRVGFNYGTYVDYVIVDLHRAALQIHEAYAVTQSGRRIQLRNLSYSGVLYAGNNCSSEYIYAGEPIVAVDVRAESMGDYADASIRIVSRSGTPSIYPIRY